MIAPELLAPAGSPDAAYAALHYGADAVYLGLDRFSARAEAENFTPEQLNALTAYAHSLTPARKIHLALNTLVQQRDLPHAAGALLDASEANVDAVIVQDLGIAKIARERFPSLTLHASTQMAIHSLEGVKTAEKLGFKRVVLARELTLPEIQRIAENASVEIEAFIHGTLCYAYSGLCLASSLLTGRSGNRGRCVYTCREAIQTPDGPRHPFSLKDLALGPRVLDLARIGVHSLKIEGRKKSPLYVAAAVDYYRRILDGTLDPRDLPAAEARLKTIFARPWTTLFLDGRHNPDAADPDVVGHRGAPVGTIDSVAATPAGPGVFFTPALPLERHDGLQIDLPSSPRPYGLPVDNLYLAGKKRLEPVFAAPAGSPVAVALPEDAPNLQPGLPLYQASSQAVKRSYPFERPKPGAFANRIPMNVAVTIAPGPDSAGSGRRCRLTAAATAAAPAFMALADDAPIARAIAADVPAFPARDPEGTVQAIRNAFSRTGDSRFVLGGLTVDNPAALYAKPGDCNAVRRTLLQALEEEYQQRRADAQTRVAAFPETNGHRALSAAEPGWIVAVDDCGNLAEFTGEDFAGVEEIVVTLLPRGGSSPEAALGLSRFAPVRFALPPILREDDLPPLRARIARLEADGHRRWLVPNLGALALLDRPGERDLAADWPLYAMNAEAARLLRTLGIHSVTLSPEDDAENCRDLLRLAADAARVIVYAEIPLFISAACAHAHLGLCRDGGDPERCRRVGVPTTMRLEKSGEISIIPLACGSVVLGPKPYALTQRLEELKTMGARHLQVDLRWRALPAAAALRIWRDARAARPVDANEANYARGMG